MKNEAVNAPQKSCPKDGIVMSKSFIFRVMGAMVILMTITACSSLYGSKESPDPVGIGKDPEELKRSPCACNEVQQDYNSWKTPV
jgi:hypothetical protein